MRDKGRAVLEYRIEVEVSLGALEAAVNQYLKHGWSPVGGPLATTGGMYAQAMVRKSALGKIREG